ncbi:hypothetical protein ACOMHN_051247 [Nucella lapillus]
MNEYTATSGIFPLQNLYASLARLSTLGERIRHYSQRASSIAELDVCVTWCQDLVTQGYSRMREFVQGGLQYQTTLTRIQALERQLEQLLREKEEVEKSTELKQAVERQALQCLRCSQCQSHLGDNCSLQQQHINNGQGTPLPSSCHPPPPPPPPPLPPLQPQTRVNFIVVKKSGSSSQAKDSLLREKEQGSSRPLVTAEDLQTVKLRPPEDRPQRMENSSQKDMPQSGRELRRSLLRKTQSAVILRDVGNMIPIQADAVAKQKQILKKTTLKRSPGGTPLRDCKRRRESGQGLTPMMNKALRLKFQAQSPCLSSDSDSSPYSSPDGAPQPH